MAKKSKYVKKNMKNFDVKGRLTLSWIYLAWVSSFLQWDSFSILSSEMFDISLVMI